MLVSRLKQSQVLPWGNSNSRIVWHVIVANLPFGKSQARHSLRQLATDEIDGKGEILFISTSQCYDGRCLENRSNNDDWLEVASRMGLSSHQKQRSYYLIFFRQIKAFDIHLALCVCVCVYTEESRRWMSVTNAVTQRRRRRRIDLFCSYWL